MKVEIVPYDSKWPALFKKEKEKLTPIFGDNLVAIMHIGSTAVPGLNAKPVIDILPIVKDIAAVDGLNKAMAKLGYLARGECGIAGRRYFTKGEVTRTHNIHAFQADNYAPIFRHIAFRNYLRSRPQVAKTYAELKEKLATLFPGDIEGYMDGKDAFIKKYEAEAVHWMLKQL